MRKDGDLLGEILLPDDVYYGAQTQRTLELFEPSNQTIRQFPSFVFSMGARGARRRIERFCGGLFSAHGDNYEGNCREI